MEDLRNRPSEESGDLCQAMLRLQAQGVPLFPCQPQDSYEGGGGKSGFALVCQKDWWESRKP